MSEPIQPTPPPVPRYGEYAPAGYVSPVQPPLPTDLPQPTEPYGSASYPNQPTPTGRARKRWDVVLTLVLLVMGLFGMLLGMVYGVAFTDTQLISDALTQQGYPGFNGDAGAAPAVLIASHVLLYLLALGAAIPLLLSRRVAFWAPLAAGIIAAIIFWSTLVGVLLSDPTFVSQIS